jgi:hypothetical protein
VVIWLFRKCPVLKEAQSASKKKKKKNKYSIAKTNKEDLERDSTVTDLWALRSSKVS